MRAAALLFALTLTTTARAQWTLQPSPTTADLRGIFNVGNGIAWASGTNGTILRTTDTGTHWQLCTIPPNAEHLDFRGIQAFDATTAIVMSSGPGDQSRLYKTTDACQTWTLLFTNPDKDGFFDAIKFSDSYNGQIPFEGVLIGDPVGGKFTIFVTRDHGDSWRRWGVKGSGWKGPCGERDAIARKDETLFAASNQSLIFKSLTSFVFVSGGKSGSRLFLSDYSDWDGPPCSTSFLTSTISTKTKSDSVGAFAIAGTGWDNWLPTKLIVVMGDFGKPDLPSETILLRTRDGFHVPFSGYFEPSERSTTQPHGYRSAVAYDPTTRTWITVGPNGTDISTDDGRNWRPLTPSRDEPADADKNWNALSLPYVVGPHGRIGILNPSALQPQP